MLAISIANNKLKLAEGMPRKDGLQITRVLQADCPPNIVSDGAINDSASLQMLFNELTSSAGIKAREAAIVVESGEIIVRDFKVPRLTDEEIHIIVEEKIGKLLNKDSGEMLTDFSFISNDDAEDLYNIMAYSVPLEMVKTYHTLLKSFKLTPRSFDVVENTLVKLISENPVNGQAQEGILMLVDIGLSSITYYGFTDGLLTFCRKDLSPVKTFLSDVSVIKKPEEAGGGDYLGELDFTPGHEHTHAAIDEYCKKLVYNLSDYITRYIQYLTFNNASSGSKLNRICICGDITARPGLSAALEKSLSIPFSPLQNVGGVMLPAGVALNEYADVIGALIRK